MAPMKYEEQLKDKLEQRTIEPSSNAWQKLSDKLDANESKKNNKGFWYLGIAASIVGVLLITTMINNGNTDITEPIIVDTNKTDLEPININTKDKIVTVDKEIPFNETEEVASENNTIEPPKKQSNNKSALKQKLNKEQHKLIPNKTNEMVVAKNLKETSKETIIKPLSFQEQKAKEVVVQIQTMQQTREVTNAEIDALLNAAQREISFKKLYNENTKTIDANALLLSVENDIEIQSFRTRVFEMLKTGYNEVKTVVAQRNN